MKKIIFILVSITLVFMQQVFAQAPALILKGKILNTEQQPVAQASVYVRTGPQKIVLRTAVTDTAGQFSIDKLQASEAWLEVSAVGYQPYLSAPLALTSTSVDLGTITLATAVSTLEAVTVEGRLPQIQQVNGKLILNVENSTLSAGNNALEILKKAPGVTVDKDDNLQLMGQGGVNVTIDGRRTYMSDDQLASFLKSLNADQIKSVEVSTSRSAKDDAEGAVGTINIVLKKNRLEGFNGTVTASAARGLHNKGNGAINLNYKKNKSTFFGSYGYADNKAEYDLSLERIVPSVGSDQLFNQQGAVVERDRNHNYRFGIEHKTSDKHTLAAQFSGVNQTEVTKVESQTAIGPIALPADSFLNTTSASDVPFNRYTININNEFKIDTLGGKVVVDLDWNKFKTLNEIDYLYRTLGQNGNLLQPQERQRSDMPVDISIYVAKVDFNKTYGRWNLESGLKYSQVNSDNNMRFEQYVDDTWQDFPGRSNHFTYKERISAAYIDVARSWGKASLKTGLRAEHTFSHGHSITLNNEVKRDYIDFFPSVNLGYTFNENHILSLGYALKVARPNYRNLNPFETFIDKYSSLRGNPYLNPQYTKGFTANYTLMRRYNFTLGADFTEDAMVESLGQDSLSGKMWIIRDNLGQTKTAYLNVNVPVSVAPFWTMNNNLTAIYMHFKGPIAGSAIDAGTGMFQGRSMHNFILSKALTAEMSANYNSAFQYNVYRIHARWGMDLGMNYSFAGGRSSLKLVATDIFKTQTNNISTDFNAFRSQVRQYNDNRTVRLTYSYKFGNLKQGSAKRLSDSDERNRAL